MHHIPRYLAFLPPPGKQQAGLELILPQNIRVISNYNADYVERVYLLHQTLPHPPLVLLSNDAPVHWLQRFAKLYFDSTAETQKLDLLLLQEMCAQAKISYEHHALRELANSGELAPLNHNNFAELFSRQPIKWLTNHYLLLQELLVLQLQHTLRIKPELLTSLLPCFHLKLSTTHHYALLQVLPAAQLWELSSYLTAINYTPTTTGTTGFAYLLNRFYATIPAAEATTKRYWFCLFFLRAMEQQNQLTAAHTLLPTQAKACHQLLTRWLDTLAHFLEKTNCDNGRHSFLVSQAKRLVTMLSPGLTSVQTQALLDECERINDRRREREEAAARRAEELQQQQRQDAEARYHAVSTMFYYG